MKGPLLAEPLVKPPNIERANTGSLFQPQKTSFYGGRAKPMVIGDTLKVIISESQSASNTIKSDVSRETNLSSKGPGNAPDGAFFKDILNQNITGSGKSTFKGGGSEKEDSSFQGQLAASVINVLANGNLMIAGERIVNLHGNESVLRFTGIVDPKDIKDGNMIASRDVVNPRLEVMGKGDLPEGTQRTWWQRFLNRQLSVW
ncbi:flagellar basal body L-ring protein FlgH [Curvibacter sp. CHRR-16]|nr:flagellar basal body L-ring protein FlgH [Curvibacter sp. CHRR-16]